MSLLSVKNWFPNWFRSENEIMNVEVHITRLQYMIDELTKLNIKYNVSPIIKTINGITNYTLIEGWEKILGIIQKTHPEFTEDDMTGFKYKCVNALTDVMVKNYTVEEITQESTNYKSICFEYNPEIKAQIDVLVKKYTSSNPPIEYPKVLSVI